MSLIRGSHGSGVAHSRMRSEAQREMNHQNICDLEMIISQEEKTVRAATRELLVRNRECIVRNIFAGRAWRLAWFAQCGGLDQQAEAAVDH